MAENMNDSLNDAAVISAFKDKTKEMFHELNGLDPETIEANVKTLVQGISYEATSRDMSQSTYSSARQGMIEDEMTFGEEQEQLLSILDEIYETFVISCVLAGKIKAEDFWDNKDDYFEHEWIKQPKKWIDPEKEAKAVKTALNTGVKTFKQIAAEEGTDWRTQIDDMAEVLEYADKKGIDLRGVLFDGKMQEEQEDEEMQNPEAQDGGEEKPAFDESGNPVKPEGGEGQGSGDQGDQ